MENNNLNPFHALARLVDETLEDPEFYARISEQINCRLENLEIKKLAEKVAQQQCQVEELQSEMATKNLQVDAVKELQKELQEKEAKIIRLEKCNVQLLKQIHVADRRHLESETRFRTEISELEVNVSKVTKTLRQLLLHQTINLWRMKCIPQAFPQKCRPQAQLNSPSTSQSIPHSSQFTWISRGAKLQQHGRKRYFEHSASEDDEYDDSPEDDED